MNIAFALLLALQSASAATPPPSCDSEAHAGFDFWVGQWDVYPNGQETKVAESRIERSHNGCAVVENWMPASGQTGTSLNHYDKQAGVWRQKWVGSSPGAVEFTGGVVDGQMVLIGNWPSPSAPHSLVRMTYSKEEGGAVRQFGEVSTDHGLTWQTSFDFLYRPKASDAE
ncbi:hypothetical protein [Erythrobacter sp. F6033]|uniref:hypothetical protein n=1 Tax=Erythrobacter sp. F6033 TaxID=2926401 RepID=UPI001FF49913|nr:hypothetical protein [Erythrobacter sp. F6033]MCK0128219.1 hypothetical protein [Erythrobacter sp. F6033]